MSDAPNIPEIYAAINRVMSKIGTVAKEGQNTQQGYKFRGIDQFINAAHPALVAEGVFCCPTVLEQTLETYEGVNSSGKPSRTFRVLLRVEHRFFGRDGSSVAVVTCGEGLDTSDKATNKAMSASQKYALIQLLMVPTADMAEADKDSPETDGKKVTQAPRTIGAPKAFEPLPSLSELVAKAEASSNGSIDRGRVVNFNKSFREALPAEFKPQAEDIRHAWLASQLILKDGNPSAEAITMEKFETIKARACAFAKEYTGEMSALQQ